MFKISLFIKYSTLLFIVISGQVYIFTTQEPQIFNETSENHELEVVKRVKTKASLKLHCEKLKLSRTSENENTLYLSKDRRFNQKLEPNRFVVDRNTHKILFFNKNLLPEFWLEFFPNSTYENEELKISREYLPKNIEEILVAKKTCQNILVVDHPLIRLLKVYKEKVSKSKHSIQFYKNVAKLMGITR